ncbi:MAG: hypothetical protein NTW44_01725 [Nitrospirae bacterium]|nr:hypothetical protein [Nitrospirota bacterium]
MFSTARRGDKIEIFNQELFDSLMSTEYNEVKGGRYERTQKADTRTIEATRRATQERARSIAESQLNGRRNAEEIRATEGEKSKNQFLKSDELPKPEKPPKSTSIALQTETTTRQTFRITEETKVTNTQGKEVTLPKKGCLCKS